MKLYIYEWETIKKAGNWSYVWELRCQIFHVPARHVLTHVWETQDLPVFSRSFHFFMSLQGARRSCRNDEVQAASEYHLSGDTLFLIRNSSPGVVENRCSCAATKAHATRDPVENPENKCFELQSFFLVPLSEVWKYFMPQQKFSLSARLVVITVLTSDEWVL